MIKTKKFIIVSFILFAGLWIGFDVYAIIKGGTENSISFVIYEWSYKYPFFTFMCGFLIGVLSGHFFWRIRDTLKTKEISDASRK